MSTASVGAPRSAAVDATAPPRPRVRAAGRVVVAAVLLGLVGQWLFHELSLGVNVPLAIGLLLAGGWLFRARRPAPRALDAWLAPLAIVFAAFVAIRADPTIVALDLGTALALAGGALASFGGRQIVDRPIDALAAVAGGAIGWLTLGAAPVLADARQDLPPAHALSRRGAPALPVLRGLLIAVPILAVFIVLFASADAVFARLVEDLVSVDLDLGDLPGRLLLGLALAWLAAGSIGLAATRGTSAPATGAEATPGWIGAVEATTVLVAVDAVFATFVALQAAYLFGGLDTLSAIGMTYADYARRGFFELVAVAILAGGLVIVLERGARRRTEWLVGSAVGLTALTGVVLVSAAARLRLYQDAYGWTELRLYVLATIILLAIGVVAMIVLLLADRVRWIGHLLLAAALVIGLGLNLLGPARFITEQNVARVLDPSLVPENGSAGLDTIYVASLGDDAIPPLVDVLPALDGATASDLRRELGLRLLELRGRPELIGWPAWNAGRAAALEALERAEEAGLLVDGS